MILSDEAKALIAETVREEVRKMLDRGSEALREIDELNHRLASKQQLVDYLETRNRKLNEENVDLCVRIDAQYQDTKLDQAVLRQVKERLETWWPQLGTTDWGSRLQAVAPAATFLTECYMAVVGRIRNV